MSSVLRGWGSCRAPPPSTTKRTPFMASIVCLVRSFRTIRTRTYPGYMGRSTGTRLPRRISTTSWVGTSTSRISPPSASGCLSISC